MLLHLLQAVIARQQLAATKPDCVTLTLQKMLCSSKPVAPSIWPTMCSSAMACKLVQCKPLGSRQFDSVG